MNTAFMPYKKFVSHDNILIKDYIFGSVNSIDERFNRQLLSKPIMGLFYLTSIATLLSY